MNQVRGYTVYITNKGRINRNNPSIYPISYRLPSYHPKHSEVVREGRGWRENVVFVRRDIAGE